MEILFINSKLYLIAFLMPLALSLLLNPLFRFISVKMGFFDVPSSIKDHKTPTPHIGGLAIAASFAITLIFLRFYTSFPTGTLRNLRIMFIGASVLFVLGFLDDIYKPKGLSVKFKFFIQFLAAVFVVFYGIKINFIEPGYLAFIISVFWIVGISNAINIIDIMDGLSGSQIVIASFGFLLIALPSEAIYVNFASAALAGAVLGFLPYNFSKKLKIFMGDSGSLFCGFLLAFIAMGTNYSDINLLGVYAPLFILSIPIYDTIFVSIMRMRRGQSPFIGSRDHFAIRLETAGFSRHKVVLAATLFSLLLSFTAFLITQVSLAWGILLYFVVGGEFLLITIAIAKIEVYPVIDK
jgi:UDP-GlcNAc:undecaprenyl-phosphate/decaprenyl-phosphate GlcNAc-1-phosphate transferase